MKRFLLFAGNEYYPLGGWRDLCGSFELAEEAMLRGGEMLKGARFNREADWFHVIDAETGSEVARG